MILPTKHLKLSNSLLSAGAALLKNVDEPKTVSLLWNKTRPLPEIRTFERFTLSLDLLFIMGIVDFKDGLIRRTQ